MSNKLNPMEAFKSRVSIAKFCGAFNKPKHELYPTNLTGNQELVKITTRALESMYNVFPPKPIDRSLAMMFLVAYSIVSYARLCKSLEKVVIDQTYLDFVEPLEDTIVAFESERYDHFILLWPSFPDRFQYLVNYLNYHDFKMVMQFKK